MTAITWDDLLHFSRALDRPIAEARARACSIDVLPHWRRPAPAIVVRWLWTGDPLLLREARSAANAAYASAASAAYAAAADAAAPIQRSR